MIYCIPPNNTFGLCSSPIPIPLIPLIPSKSHQNPSFHPPLSTAPEMFKKFLHPKPIRFQLHINILEKKLRSDGLPHGTSQIAFRFLFEASLQKPPRASRHSDSILQEESCLEMFNISLKNWDKDL